jgi:hypothetical protein
LTVLIYSRYVSELNGTLVRTVAAFAEEETADILQRVVTARFTMAVLISLVLLFSFHALATLQLRAFY